MESKLYEVSEYKKIVEDLLNGKVVGFPTETVYGLAIIYNDKSSFDKLYEIKNRSITKPISMMVSDRNVIEQVAYVNETQQKVIDNLMPGALTVILKSKEEVRNEFIHETVGVRIPNHDLALRILKENGPMATSSVNTSGSAPLNDYIDIVKSFGDKVLYVYPNVELPSKVSSTVIDLSNGECVLIREGDIKFNEIVKFLNK